MDDKWKIAAMFAGIVFHTYGYQLKSGVHNDNTFNYQLHVYRNWLFGFTLAPAIIIIWYYAVNNNNDDNIKHF